MVVSSMKKQSKIIVAVLAALFLAVAAMACVHFATREKVPVNTLAIHAGKDVVYVDLDKLNRKPVQGTLTNARGDKIEIDAQGAALADILRMGELDVDSIQSVTVSAADEYSASLSGAEVNESEKTFLIFGEDGLQLVVFGDENMKRSVHKVVSVDVQ